MESKERQPRTFLGLRVSALVESFLFLGFIIFCDFIFGSGNRFMDIYPHPFWIVVLLITVQYGTTEGLASAFLAILFLYAGNIPDQLVEETTFDYQFRLSLRPFLWLSAAFILGELRMHMQGQIDKLKCERDDAREQAKTFGENYELLKTTKENLESRLAGQINTIASTYETVRGLETLNPVQILTCLDNVVQATLKPTKFSVFASGPNGLEATISRGWADEDNFLRRFTTDHSLYREIVEKKRMVSIVNQEDEQILAGEGVMAAPLIDTHSGEVFGMIKLEEVDFMKLDIGNLETFKTLCDLIGTAYSNAKKYVRAMSNTIFVEETGIFSYNLYSMQRGYLENLSLKTGTPLSNLSVKLQEQAQVDDEEEQAILSAVYHILVDKLSDGTPIFHGKEEKFMYLVLLPAMTEQQTEQLSMNILEAFQNDPKIGKYRFCFKTKSLVDPQRAASIQ